MTAAAGLLGVVWLVCAAATVQAQTSGFAPVDQVAFDRLVSGKQVGPNVDNRLVILSPGRIREYAQGTANDGDYGYVNTGSNTGTLTYTYDVTGNDPDAEKTVVEMTFTSATTGTFVSTYTERGSPPETLRGPFALVDADPDPPGPDHAPADQAAFNTRFVGKTVVGTGISVLFLSGDRLRETDSEGTYAGSYSWEKSQKNRGTLLVRYDDGDRCLSQIVFASDTTGTYASRCADGSTEGGSFRLVAGDAPADQAAFDRLVGGKQVGSDADNRLVFLSPGRLREYDRGTPYDGDYRYVNTGPDTGTLTYTYDVTGNDPDAEKTVVEVTFTSATEGTLVSTYTERGYAPETLSGSFELADAAPDRPAPPGHAPADQAAFNALVVGKRATGVDGVTTLFESGDRFREGPYAGRYAYRRTGADTGTLRFDYDDGDWCDFRIAFTSAATGRYAYVCSGGERGNLQFEVRDGSGTIALWGTIVTFGRKADGTYGWSSTSGEYPGSRVSTDRLSVDGSEYELLEISFVPNQSFTCVLEDDFPEQVGDLVLSFNPDLAFADATRSGSAFTWTTGTTPDPGEPVALTLSRADTTLPPSESGADVNGDGTLDADDALVMYYAYALESLLGDGATGGVERFRRTLLAGRAGRPNPSDADLQLLLRRANELRASSR